MSNVKIIEPSGSRQRTLGELECKDGVYAVTGVGDFMAVWQKNCNRWRAVVGPYGAGVNASGSLIEPARLLPSGTIIQIEVP